MKPLLAAALENVEDLKFPVLASPKLDGIRVLIRDGIAITRTLKPVRNKYIQSIIGKKELNGLDGEIVVGAGTDPLLFRSTASGVMSEDGEPDFTYHVFDRYDMAAPFEERYNSLVKTIEGHDRVQVLPHMRLEAEPHLQILEKQFLQAGYEGVMLRSLTGKYKFGRSTIKEGILLKLKRFKQEEFEIIGFHERMHNANEAKTNALGQTERSSHKENMIGRGDLGAIQVKTKDGKEFSIGSGFTDMERAEIWGNQKKYMGQFATCKFMDIGEYDVPRFPIYMGIRPKEDMSV